MENEMISKINNLIQNNTKVIHAIDNGEEINIKKAIKACMKSNNELANIFKEFLINKNIVDKVDYDVFKNLFNKK